MFRTVTVGLDGTPESHAAAGWAAREALSRDVPLQLVQVQETGAYPDSPLLDTGLEREWAQRVRDETLAELSRRYPRLYMSAELASGRPAHVLTELSATTDLLVLGSRGLASVLGYIVGSAALPTVAHAKCPVVLVRAEPDGAGEVVLGLDLNRRSDELLAFAFEAAARREAPLRVLHGWGESPPAHTVTAVRHVPVPRGMSGELFAERNAERNNALSAALYPWREKFPDLGVTAEAVFNRPARLLVDAAPGASLVVVGRRVRRSRVGTHLGPVTHSVMHHARTPVAVVPHD